MLVCITLCDRSGKLHRISGRCLDPDHSSDDTRRTAALATRTCVASGAKTHLGEKMSKPVFVIRGLTKIYRTGEVEVRALAGVDLDVAPGELIVLLGPSGSGKSTFLNIVGGLDIASHGTVHFREKNLTYADERALTEYRRRHVGFVFQCVEAGWPRRAPASLSSSAIRR
jgi:ABC-type glutathione transport system ATPase component